MGWVARTATHHCPYNSTLFNLQISILIICAYSDDETLFQFLLDFCLALITPKTPTNTILSNPPARCFFSAGIYYILGSLIRVWGRQYSLISANF